MIRPLARFAIVVIALAASASAAQDFIAVSALHRVAPPGARVRIKVMVKDNSGTPAGRGGVDPIVFLAVQGLLATGSANLSGPEIPFVDSGIAVGIPNQGSAAGAGLTAVRQYLQPLAFTDGIRGDLIGYAEATISLATPPGSTLSLDLKPSNGFLAGADIYPVSVDGDPSSEETVANGFLNLVNFNPADANGDSWATEADLAQVQSDVAAAPGSAITEANQHSDCDVDGALTAGDVLCVFAELHGIGAVYPATSPVDVDFDGKADALTDGILVVRQLVGLSDEVLIQNVVSSDGRRVNPIDIAEFVTAIKPVLDVDGDGTADALTDGILLVRYLAGLRGDALVTQATAAGAPRSTAQIEEYLGMLTRGYEL